MDGRIRIFSDTMTSQNWRQYLPRKFIDGCRSKANSFCAPWAYFQSFSLYAVKCRFPKLNAEISYARRQLDTCKLFTLSTAQNGRQKQLDEQESNTVLDDSGLDLQEPVPGGTIGSILSESGVNTNTCGRANSI